MRPIETQRLLLREFQEDDWQAVHEYGADPEVVRYMSWGPNTKEETKDFIARQLASQIEEPRRHHGFAIALEASNELIENLLNARWQALRIMPTICQCTRGIPYLPLLVRLRKELPPVLRTSRWN